MVIVLAIGVIVIAVLNITLAGVFIGMVLERRRIRRGGAHLCKKAPGY